MLCTRTSLGFVGFGIGSETISKLSFEGVEIGLDFNKIFVFMKDCRLVLQ